MTVLDIPTIDVSDDVEAALQELHEDETFVYRAPKRVWVDACATCNDRPIWGCKAFGCSETETCFILCPSCGKNGNAPAPEQWSPNWELAALLIERLNNASSV